MAINRLSEHVLNKLEVNSWKYWVEKRVASMSGSPQNVKIAPSYAGAFDAVWIS